jgi:hypothetical protein
VFYVHGKAKKTALIHRFKKGHDKNSLTTQWVNACLYFASTEHRLFQRDPDVIASADRTALLTEVR